MDENKRRVKINLNELVDTFSFYSEFDETSRYLNIDTGEIVWVTEEARQALETLLEGSEAETIDAVTDVIQNASLTAEQKDELHAAAQIDYGDDNFIEIPHIESWDGYETMVDFIETVSDRHLQELLAVAIRGKGAFRRFKDVLLGYPETQERWFQFKAEQHRHQVLKCLASKGIEFVLD